MDSAIPVLFTLVAVLITLVPLVIAVRAGRRLLWIRRAVHGGLRAEGRCVRVYTTVGSTGEGPTHSRQHFVFAFRTADGRDVRFEDPGAPGTTIEGDHLTVAYVPEAPERALVVPAGYRVPYGQLALTFLFLAIFIVLGIVLVVGGVQVAGAFDDFSGYPDFGGEGV
ncbi:DUF3592 domain-containing protein [Streptomyces sp. NPDC026673]|uniref:DUF3592 domain-containing protein n=1 Tax=Streptomyces sp. NPDC026673 TaxID=3155724 RepID=UPI0033F7D3A2